MDASISVELGDEAYDALERLEAEGVIQSGLLSTRPISRGEALRLALEAERNSAGKSPYIKRLIAVLTEKFKAGPEDVDYVKPADRVYLRYAYSDQASPVLNYNENGDPLSMGSNLRAGFSSNARLGRLSLSANPELRMAEGQTDLVAPRAYASIDAAGLELLLGRDVQWWGPGRHGSLLLSNNAPPFTIARLSNPSPALLPWIFNRLGPFRFVFFVTRLDEERTVPEPLLWGLRLNFKPLPHIEVGLQRTAMLGGEGRSESIETWLRSFTGRGENDTGKQAGNQLAGFDLKVTLPFDVQPMQFYLEAAGEDEVGGLPSKWACLWGVYLPHIGPLERLGLRCEYADTIVEGSPGAWYGHGVYATGYTFKGRIIGHHMGADSTDLFVEASYAMPARRGWLKLAHDRERRRLVAGGKLEKLEYILSARLGLRDGMSLEGRAAFAELDEGQGKQDASLFLMGLVYDF